MDTTITALRNQLIKGGLNLKDANRLAKKHNAYLNRVYRNASIRKKAKIALTLG